MVAHAACGSRLSTGFLGARSTALEDYHISLPAPLLGRDLFCGLVATNRVLVLFNRELARVVLARVLGVIGGLTLGRIARELARGPGVFGGLAFLAVLLLEGVPSPPGAARVVIMPGIFFRIGDGREGCLRMLLWFEAPLLRGIVGRNRRFWAKFRRGALGCWCQTPKLVA